MIRGFALLAALLVLVFSAPSNAHADEPVIRSCFVGQLLSVTMTRRDMSERIRPDADGAIVVSISCGTLEATFRVVRSEARLPSRVVVVLSMGHWCVQRIPFEAARWLVVLDRETQEYVEAYQLFEENGPRMFAFQENDREVLARYSPRVQRLLAPEALSEPVHYPFPIYGDKASFVEGEPDLVLGDNWVLITRGVPVDRIFPGFTVDEFYD